MSLKISQLPEISSLDVADIFPVVDVSAGIAGTSKITLANLRLAIGLTVAITSISTLTPAANKIPYYTSSTTAGLLNIGAAASSDIIDRSTGDSRYAQLSGATFTGAVVLSADPITALGAATKQYVDNAIAGVNWKGTVRAATTANITLSGTQTVDGVALGVNDDCLVRNQTLPQENGIYVVSASGWSRRSDMNVWAEVPGAAVFVREGTTQADIGYVCTSNTGGTLGTTAITFVQFSSAGAVTAGVGIVVTGNQVALGGQALALHNLATNGLITRTGAGTVVGRTITAGTNISVTNGDGVAGNPTISITGTIAAANLPTFGTAAAGIVPASGGGTSNFLRADGTWAQATSLPNVASSVTGNTLTLTATLTAARAVTFQDATYTVAGINIAQTYSALQTFSSGLTVSAGTITLPAASVSTAAMTGVLAAAQMPAHTGDVTSTSGSVALTIANSAVTLAKMANLAANSIIGNNTGSAATPIALTATQVKTLLAIASTDVSGLGVFATGTNAANLTGTVPVATLPVFTTSTAGVVPASGGGTTNFLRADGTWANPAAPNLAVDRFVTGTNFTPGVTTTLTLSQTPPSLNACIVTYDGISQHRSQFSLAGAVITFTSAIPLGVKEIEVTSLGSVLVNTVNDGAITLAKMANLAANSIIGNDTGSAAVPIALSTAQVVTLLAVPTLAANNTLTGANVFQNATGLTIKAASTTDAIIIDPASIGSSSRSITLATPDTALPASYIQVFQARNGVVALQGEGLYTNFFHNGDVQVDQRDTLTTPRNVTGGGICGPDGWVATKNNATHVVTIGKVAITNTPATGALYACKLNVTTGATVGAGEILQLYRAVEGTMFRRASFGTAQAATLYLSFWAEATITGTFSASIKNGSSARSYVINFTITSANTRRLFQAIIPGDTTGTWASDNTVGAYVAFTAACGSTFQTTAGAWQAGNFAGTSSTTLLNGITGSLQITDCYLGTTPIGNASVDFPRLPYDVELQRCQRYLRRYQTSASASYAVATGGMDSTTAGRFFISFDLPMRDVPVLAVSAVGHFAQLGAGSASQAATVITLSTNSSNYTVQLTVTSAAGSWAGGQQGRLTSSLVAGGYLDLSSELQ